MGGAADASKTCTKCGERKSLETFTVRSKNSDGHTSRCRACVNAYNKRLYASRSDRVREKLRAFNKRLRDDRAEKVFNYLRGHPCVDCGEPDPVVLEFDHRETEVKKLAVAQMVERRYAWEAIAAEIAKCDVRCANCHRRKTSRERRQRRTLLQERCPSPKEGRFQ